MGALAATDGVAEDDDSLSVNGQYFFAGRRWIQ
jgi:hypothetical protein